jgi:membrane fusion protein, heavy metal efflux system
MKINRRTWLLAARVGLAGLCIFLVGAGITVVRTWLKPQHPPSPGESSYGPRLSNGGILLIPPETQQSLGIRIVEARAATRQRDLPPLAGSLGLDVNRLARVHSRFPGEVVAIGTTATGPVDNRVWHCVRPLFEAFPAAVAACERPLRYGDKVEQGQLLAVVWSKELGEKKSELVDALSQEHLDRETLKHLEKLAQEGAIAEVRLREARRSLQSSVIAVAKAERTLDAWRLTKAEIAAIRDEAERLIRAEARIPFDPSWARVEIRAPMAGTVLEKNLNIGDIIDPATNLYKIVDLTRLTVWAHIYEEDLPALNGLPQPIPWTVQLKSDPGAPPIPGAIDTIGTIIDPTQHTALLTGTVDNRAGRLRPGQFVTATVQVPSGLEETEIPTAALVENGEESIVFVQPDPDRLEFTIRHVLVTRRLQDVVYVRSELSESERRGPQGQTVSPLRPGERVVSRGANELRQTLDNLHDKSGSHP